MKKLLYLLAIVVTLQCTAYCDKGITASGVMPAVGMCAVDKINGEWVKFGTRITLPDGRVLTVTDRFGAGHNNHLDIWMPSEDKCWEFDRQNLRCEVEIP